MNNDNQTSVIANAYLNMLKDRFAPKEEVVDEAPVEETAAEETKEEGTPE